ncbi:MAG: hypothetical protein ACFCGT_22410 [Sandaracinaceae bacterium]
MNDGWTALDPTLGRQLTDARLAVHWAAQLASAPGTSLLPPEDDFGHTTLRWDPTAEALRGAALPVGLAAALRLAPFTLALLEGDGRIGDELPLAGRTLDDGLRWLTERLREHAHGDLRAPIDRPRHDLPSHPVEAGAAFDTPEPRHLRELAAWFGNAQAALEETRLEQTGTSPVRVWPHHFDIAALSVLDPELDPEVARSVGFGMAPGDAGVPEPYFYVNCWPPPPSPSTPALGHGETWHTEGWVGASLASSALRAGAEQGAQVRGFLRDAIRACKGMLQR